MESYHIVMYSVALLICSFTSIASGLYFTPCQYEYYLLEIQVIELPKRDKYNAYIAVNYDDTLETLGYKINDKLPNVTKIEHKVNGVIQSNQSSDVGQWISIANRREGKGGGPICDRDCFGPLCDPDCEDPNCDRRCDINECGDECDDDSCDKSCNKSRCEFECDDDLDCHKDCFGPHCDHDCEGDDCDRKCEGPECAVDCIGDLCDPDCEDSQCTFKCGGPGCTLQCFGGSELHTSVITRS